MIFKGYNYRKRERIRRKGRLFNLLVWRISKAGVLSKANSYHYNDQPEERRGKQAMASPDWKPVANPFMITCRAECPIYLGYGQQ